SSRPAPPGWRPTPQAMTPGACWVSRRRCGGWRGGREGARREKKPVVGARPASPVPERSREKGGGQTMVYRMLADLVLLLHLGFILFVAAGALLVLRWPRLVFVHLPCA